MKKVFGIVGHPVTHSLSPAMHNAAFKEKKIDAEYKIFDLDPADPENLANFCYESEVKGISGFSVTMPYKAEVMQYMDKLDPLAKLLGSVNTVICRGPELEGYNTDSPGALMALKEKTDVRGKRVLVLGAGGAARAVAYGLKEFGATIEIYNRTPEAALELADELEIDAIEYRLIPEGHFDIIINTTSVGSSPEASESLLHAAQFGRATLAMDVVTHPLETRFLKEAKLAGADTISGERMLLHQAALQYEIWFKKSAPIAAMEAALYAEIARRK